MKNIPTVMGQLKLLVAVRLRQAQTPCSWPLSLQRELSRTLVEGPHNQQKLMSRYTTPDNQRIAQTRQASSPFGTRSAILKWGIFALLSVVLLSCSSSGYRFANSEPVQRYNDMLPGPVPEKDEFQRAYYTYDLLVRRPIVQGMEVPKYLAARDVNARDEVPASSWYTPRLGYREISPEELLRGPQKIGPPQPPVRVAKAKHGGGNPGFIIKDSRGYFYLVKFDPPEFPAVETTTALIVNRLFWGFGYNVPEDYLAFFQREDFTVAPGGNITRADVEQVLSLVASPQNGRYRTTVSLLIKGIILGPIPAEGVRKGDVNDKFDHKNRRTLRALRVFNSFTNHTDMRIDNTLDVYEGAPGQGFVRHYLLDFGEAFAGHAVEHQRLWDGFHHLFSFRQMFKNLVLLGLNVEAWENIKYTPWKSVGTFESEVYDPADWKEVLPYLPIHYSQPEDNYWAAKILGALTDEHIKTLVAAAQYPEPGAAEYVVETLKARRRKTLQYFLAPVTPVEFVVLKNRRLVLEDRGNILLGLNGDEARYQIRIFDGNGKEIVPPQQIAGKNNQLTIPISSELFRKAGQYLRVDVRKISRGRKAPRPAQFHLRGNGEGLRLVGVVH